MNAKIGSVVLGVRDLDRAVIFYRDLIGLPLAHMKPAQSFAEFDAGGVGLKVVGGHEPSAPQYAVIEIVVNDLDAAYAELSARGVDFPMPPTKQPWGGWLAQMRDPDGNLFYLTPAA
jgi:predicted enzyme related to lactoylglutathione lyase